MNGIMIHRKILPVLGKWECCECREEKSGGRPLVLTPVAARLIGRGKGVTWFMCQDCAPDEKAAREIMASKGVK